jgi:hypothetical protein
MRARLLLSYRLNLGRIGGETRSAQELVVPCAPMIGENLVDCAWGLFCFEGGPVQMLCKGDQSLPPRGRVAAL